MSVITTFSECRRKGGNKSMDGNIKDISVARKKEIEKIVNKILDENKTEKHVFENSLIVDIVRLVKNYDFAVQSAEMDLDTTGCLMVNDREPVLDTKKNRLILVNSRFYNANNDENVVLKKSRFITAHEYGHFVLHKQEGVPIYAHRDTSRRTDPMELEADYFARSILMPLDVFRSYVQALKRLNILDDKAQSVYVLSAIFKVTKDKVQKRIKDLDDLRDE